ncbi:MAG TPA: Ig-like domain-containing protein [Patescibacteria group bacterium]|nr:Ig-like domain-containing protein [Patescibacteria group bacterium]
MPQNLLKNIFENAFGIICAAWIFSGCANMLPPPGGPKDVAPPTISTTSVQSGTTDFRGNSITLEFSEWVNQGSVLENIFLSPPKDMEFDWSGRELEVTFKEPLDPNTTYALTIGAGYADLTGNKPTESHTIIFSTGSQLDSGIIRGTLTTTNPAGWYIFAYQLDGIDADTLNPAITKPKYRTQVGTSGTFEIRALPAGRYRVLAIKDEFNNGVYDESQDAFGTFLKDVTIAEGTVSEPVNIRAGAALDRNPPDILDAEALNRRTIRVTFSENLDTASVISANFVVTDSSGVVQNPVHAVQFGLQNPRFVEIFTANSLTENTRWRVAMSNIRDAFQNQIPDTARRERFFLGSTEPDTAALRIAAATIADSTIGHDLNAQFDITFTKPINRAAFENGATLTRTFTNQPVGVNFTWRADNVVRVIPQSRLDGDAWYEFRAPLQNVRDVQGNPAQDTTLRLRFQTVDIRTYGGVKGTLVDSLSTGGQYVITLTGQGKRFQKTIVLKSPGMWEFSEVPPGSYKIEAFEDKDSDLKYSYGSVRPFHFAERFATYSGDISVKARWTVENVRIIF